MAITTSVRLSDTGDHTRLDAEFYQPHLIINFSKGNWKPIKRFLSVCQYGISQAMTEEPIGMPIFRMDDIKDTFLLDDEVKYVEVSKDIADQYRLETDDVLFNRVNSEEFVGRTGIVKLKGKHLFASYLIRLRTKRNCGILPDYLNIFLNTRYGKRQIQRFLRRAVNQANVNAEELKNFRIAVLPIETQREVGRLCNEAWHNIERSKSLYLQAETLVASEVGVKDFSPKHETFYFNRLSNAFMANRIDAEHFQPAHEKVVNKILNYKDGYSNLLDAVDHVDAEFNPVKFGDKVFSYIELADIDGSIGVVHSASRVRGSEAPSRARRLLREGDVIVSSVEGSLEKVALIDETNHGSLASTGFFQFRPCEISAELLLILAKSILVRTQLKRECAGTILTAVQRGSLRKLIIPTLPKKTEEKVTLLVRQSHEARRKARHLLEGAKRKVEEAIDNFS